MKHSPRSSALRWIVGAAREQYGRILLLILVSAISALTSVGYALVCKGVIDAAVSGNATALTRSIVLIAVLLVLDLVFSVSNRILTEQTNATLYIHLQRRCIHQLISRQYAGTSAYHSGELLNRVFSDTSVIASGLTGILPSLAYLIARLTGAAASLFILAPAFMALFLVIGVALFLVMTLLREPIKRLHKRLQETDGSARAFMQEILERLLVIKVFDAGEAVGRKLDGFQRRYRKARVRSKLVSIASGTGFSLIFDLGHILALIWGSLGIFHGRMSYGTLTAMLQLVGQVQQPFAGLSGIVSQYFTVTASAERIMELEALPEQNEQQTVDIGDLQAIRLEHVDFTYGRASVLRDANVVIRPGDMVSITGISGGGKSTLFLLLLGAYQPTAGQVRFEFTDGSIPPGDAACRLFAYVPQGNYLISGTLRENLTFFQEDIPDSRLWEALETACAAEFVRALPQGLDTLLGEKGHGLSEGQMQRIAIARALTGNAPVLLLDEATSALDEAAEAQLLQNIAQLPGRTCLIVTHRRPALAICSRHLRIRDGYVIEENEGDIHSV